MKPPKMVARQIIEANSTAVSILPQITVGAEVKEILNSLIKVFMDISCATASTIPAVVQEWKPQVSNGEVAHSFIRNSDHVCRLFANFLKGNPFYNRLTMADRCSTFFQSGTRLNRIFNVAPAAMNQRNFNKLQTMFPDFQVSYLY